MDCRAGYGPGHDYAALGLMLHQMTGNTCGQQVCTVDIDNLKLLDTLEGLCHGIELRGEACRIDEVIES